MKKKIVFNSPRLLEIQKKKRKLRRNKILFFSFAILGLFFGASMLSRIHSINVLGVKVEGNKIIDSFLIEDFVKERLEGRFLWLMPKTNYLLIPKRSLERDLAHEYKRLKDVQVDIKDGSLVVTVGERSGLFTWCGETLPPVGTLLEDTKCYFMDETGYIFDIAPYFSGDVYFKYFGKIENKESPAGNTFLAGKFVELNAFRETVGTLGVEPVTLLIKEDSEGELYLSSQKLPPNSQKIIFNTSDDLVRLAENLNASITSDSLGKDLKKKYNSLEYIDLRFGNKVYYKFK